MNAESVIRALVQHLSEILHHDLMFAELVDIIKQSGSEPHIFKQLLIRLRQLSVKGILAVELEEFENIGDGLYSMHLAAKGYNIRILYAFLPNKQPVLLLAFYKRSGKGKTDYSTHIPPAKDRLATIKKEYYNGNP